MKIVPGILKKLTRRKRKAARKGPGLSFVRPAPLPGTPLPLPREIQRKLRCVAGRKLGVALAEGCSLILAVVSGAWISQGLVDWVFNLPWTVRLFLLIGDSAGVAFILWKFAFLPVRKRLSLPMVALLVEREIPSFRSLLISAVELSSGQPGHPQGSLDLVRETIARAAAHISELNVATRVVKTARLKRWLLWAVSGGVLFTSIFLWIPQKSNVLLQRILLSHSPLPTKTMVLAITEDMRVPLGSNVVLSAKAQGIIPKSGRVFITYSNNKRDVIPVTPGVEDNGVFSISLKNIQQPFSYYFALNDGTGVEFNVNILLPPTIESCRFVQNYPKYTGIKAAEMSPGNLSLLAGSRLQIEAKTTQPLRSAVLQIEGSNRKIPLAISGLGKRSIQGELAVPKEGLTGFSFLLENADGIPSVQNTVYHTNFIPDNPPEVELTAPTADTKTLTVRARPVIEFKTKDDYGIQKVILHYETVRPAPNGSEPAPESGSLELPPPPGGTLCKHSYLWDMAKQNPPLAVGCKVQYWIEAIDNNDVTGPGTAQSAKKTFEFVSQEAKEAELQEALSAKANDIGAIHETQTKVNEDLDNAIRKYQAQ